MKSTIIGQISFNEQKLAREIQMLQGFLTENVQYNEFVIGSWDDINLWNASGKQKDSIFQEVSQPIVKTELGGQLTYLNEVLESCFHLDRCQMIRAFRLKAGVLIPHKDFLEVDNSEGRFLRIHIMLETNDTCFHSNENTVFQMRKGEIWIFDAFHIHSACCFSTESRISICLDFLTEGAPPRSIFKDLSIYDPTIAPKLIDREPMTEDFLDGILGLRHVINELNYREIIGLLAKAHFYVDAPTHHFFDWLIDITAGPGNEHLRQKFIGLKHYLLEGRRLAERYAL